MATSSLCNFLRSPNHINTPNHLNITKPEFKFKFQISCRTQGGKKTQKLRDNKKKKLEEIFKEIKENMMRPRQKGDWKDLVLMSLSFAVYVYISQRIVIAYCTWVSILKSSF